MLGKDFPGVTFYQVPVDIVSQILNFGLGLARVEPQAASASGDHDADVGIDQFVYRKGVANRRGHVVGFHRDL